jgi:hypothetical protein
MERERLQLLIEEKSLLGKHFLVDSLTMLREEVLLLQESV